MLAHTHVGLYVTGNARYRPRSMIQTRKIQIEPRPVGKKSVLASRRTNVGAPLFLGDSPEMAVFLLVSL